MSGPLGLSKADREIIAQGVFSNDEERVAKVTAKELFGTKSSGTSEASVPTLGDIPQFGAKTSSARQRKSILKPVKKFSPKGKMPIRSYDQEDDQEVEWDELPESSRGRPTIKRTQPEVQTALDWASFYWKPDPKNFLKGISNYSIYKESLSLQLECVGYEPETKLTRLDELKLAAVIQRTIVPELAELIAGMKSGSSMMRLFESTFRREGTVQLEALWSKLTNLKYVGGCPIIFVTRFKTDIRNYQNSGGSLSDFQIMMFFKQAVRGKAKNWHEMVSSFAQFQEWKLGTLLQSFTSYHHERIGKGDNSNNSKPQFQGTLGSAQGQKDTRPENNPKQGPRKGKGQRNGVRCYNCGCHGHIKKDCQKKANDKGKTSMVANKKAQSDLGPPEAIADEYCKIPEYQLSGGSYATQVKPQTFDEVVQFYEKEMDRRRRKVSEEDNSLSDKMYRHDDDKEVSNRELPIATVQVTQQILSTAGGDKACERWLFDTGADIDATNNIKNFRPGTIVELRPGQFPIQTGNGTVHAESMGEVWLPLTGPNGSKSTMRLKYVAFLKDFPLNVVSGERFY